MDSCQPPPLSAAETSTAPPARVRRLRPAICLAAASALIATGLTAPAGAAPASPEPAGQNASAALNASAAQAPRGTETFPGNDGRAHRVGWDEHSFSIDGERLNLYSGEFHMWRQPSPEHWRDLLQKIRAAGFNGVSLYVFWGYHSSAPGQYDFGGIRDLDRLLTMAAEEGLYVIARPGPYINAEVSMGGLPAYLTNNPEGLRTTEPKNLAASKEWLAAVDRIIAAHQVTDGGGSVLMYQVENEMLTESPERAAFVAELVKQVKADGITVPLFHNDYNLGGRFTPAAHGGTGAGANIGLDFYAYDDYPLGFNCAADRNGIRDREMAFRSVVKDNPIFISEAQGGAFTPWGAAFTPEKCADFVDPSFTRQWGVNNIGQGVTAFNYYMAHGGTNWGWTGSPSSGFSSYDYGAALDEHRSLTDKYSAQKQIGHQLAAQPDIASMQRIQPPPVTVEGDGSQAGVLALSRQATGTDRAHSVTGNGSRYLGFRQADSNATTTSRFTTSLSLGQGRPMEPASFTTDDSDTTAIGYTGDWTHASGESWTKENFNDSESFSNRAGDKATYRFNGSAIQVVMPQSTNHGRGDVLIDGVKVGQTDSFHPPQNQSNQWIAFEKSDLAPGEHTIEVVVTGESDPASEDTFVSIDAFNVPGAGDGEGQDPPRTVKFDRVPAEPGTTLTLHGRDATSVIADQRFGEHELYYSTSEVVGNLPTHDGTLLVLNGRDGDAGETVLHYPRRPKVAATGADVKSTWDARTRTLRLNYQHGQPAEVTLTSGGRAPLRLQVSSRDQQRDSWQVRGATAGSGAAGVGPNATTLVRGAHLVRTVRYEGDTAHLTGSMRAPGRLTIDLPPGIDRVTFNGEPLTDQQVAGGRITGGVPGPAPVALPGLTSTRAEDNAPARPEHDDASWRVADHTTTLNPRQGPGNQGVVLDSNAYGAYEGDVWYRAHYTADTALKTVSLTGNGSTGAPAGGAFGDQLTKVGGTAAHLLVWVNGHYLGARPANGKNQTLEVPEGLVKAGEPVVLSTVVRNLGQNLDWSDDGLSRQNRGLHDATLGNRGPATWKIQGAAGFGAALATGPGAQPADPVRGLYNNGGLDGERAGWHLPGFDASGWQPAADLHAADPGVTWFRSGFDLAVPAGQDTTIGLKVNSRRFATRSDPSRLVLFVNGWNIGIHAGNVGPQDEFAIPSGLLNMDGRNEIAVAMTAEEAGAGPESLSLVTHDSVTGGMPATSVPAPGHR